MAIASQGDAPQPYSWWCVMCGAYVTPGRAHYCADRVFYGTTTGITNPKPSITEIGNAS